MFRLLALLPAISAPVHAHPPLRRSSSWSVISSHSDKMLNLMPSTQRTSETTRELEVTPVAVNAVQLVYANWYGGTFNGALTMEMPNSNQITIKAAIQLIKGKAPQNDSQPQIIVPVTFRGAESTTLNGGDSITSDPISVSIPKGGSFYVRTFVDSACPAAPAAPNLGVTGSNGKLSAGEYTVCLTSLFPNGVESLPSLGNSISVRAGQSIEVRPPARVSGSIGYRVYVSQAGEPSPTYALASSIQGYSEPYFVTVLPEASIENSSIRVMTPGAIAQYPVGAGVAGGNGPGSCANGEGFATGYDFATSGVIPANTDPANFGPTAVLGQPVGSGVPSIAAVGDSIVHAWADAGFGADRGGFSVRFATNEFGIACSPLPSPSFGHLWLAQAKVSAADFAGPLCQKNADLAALCDYVVSDLGTDELSEGSVPLIQNTLAIAHRYTTLGKTFVQTTLLPKTVSSDSWRTISGQTVSDPQEGFRRQFNRWLLAQGQQSISGEAPYVGSPAPKSPAQNINGLADGAATVFVPSLPFVQGSMVVSIDGTVQRASDYWPVYVEQIAGVSYGSGIQFATAPKAGSRVTVSYKSAPGFTTMAGKGTAFFDAAGAVEVNASGSFQTNGGWWKPGAGDMQPPSQFTLVQRQELIDTTRHWTQDQWRGYCARVVSDPKNPSAVGQVDCISSNDSNTLHLGAPWTTTPSMQAVYAISHSLTDDGVHPTTEGHILIAKRLAASNIGKLIVNHP